MSDQNTFRAVNQSLGDSPSVGPVSGNQIVPWAVLAGLGWFISELLGFGLLEKACAIAWLIFSWSLLTGAKPWEYLSKYVPLPYWTCGYKQYKSLLD